MNYGIPPIQNKTNRPYWSGKMHIISKLFDWPTFLFCCVELVSVFLERVHRTLKVSEWFTPDFRVVFQLFCLPFGCCSEHCNCCNIHLKFESIAGQLQNQLSWQNFGAVLRQVFFVLTAKVFGNTVLKHYSQTMCTRTLYIRTILSTAINHTLIL